VTKPSEIAPQSFIFGFSSDGYIPSFGLRSFIHNSLCLNTFTLDPLSLKPFMVCLSSKGMDSSNPSIGARDLVLFLNDRQMF
jgi:hypothetical protein